MIEVDIEDPIWRASILFVQTAQAVLKAADTYLYKNARTSVIKLVALQSLASNNGVMRPTELAEWTQTERHNITALVQRMKRDGLVTSERDTKDKRIVHIILTDKGRDALNQAMPVAREFIDQTMSSISEDDVAQFDKQLRILRGNAFDTLRQTG